MNIEKVLDIAVQADPSTVEVLGEVGGRAFIAGNGIRPQFIQKFAELIVRECIKVCEPVFLDESYEDMSEFGKGLVEGQDVAVEKIKEHFGVAE